jgi:branched-chain amino acid transport system permease protein
LAKRLRTRSEGRKGMKKKDKAGLLYTFGAIALIYIAVIILEQTVNSGHILFTVLKKGAIYSLVAVSMNL